MVQQLQQEASISHGCESCKIAQTESYLHELGYLRVGDEQLLAVKGLREVDLLHPKKVELCHNGQIQESGLDGVELPDNVAVHRRLGGVGVLRAVVLGNDTCILNRRAFM